MDAARIVSEIDAQIARLEQARKLLSGDATPTTAKGRPGAREGHTVSPEARARIAAAQRARWAKQMTGKKK